MAREIGSEFHKVAMESGHGLVLPIQGSLVFSGRTAIETVLKEMPDVKKAMLPSYCCDSMIVPFRDVGIEVSFYPVNYKNGIKIAIDILENIDILLWCDYFGFYSPMPDFSEFINRGGVIIEDITHSMLSTHIYHTQSRYLVASLRKWEPISCGGYCAKVDGKLQYNPIISPPEGFMKLKKVAMELKAEYLDTLDKTKKSSFFLMFEEANHWLAENYSELSIDQWSREYLDTVDVEKQRNIRCSNAHTLYEQLDGLVQFLFPEEDMDCPLFVPILLQNRDEIRRILIANQIYCPVHWPRPEGCESNLYDIELSLICDQRYNEEDMEKIVAVLKKML